MVWLQTYLPGLTGKTASTSQPDNCPSSWFISHQNETVFLASKESSWSQPAFRKQKVHSMVQTHILGKEAREERRKAGMEWKSVVPSLTPIPQSFNTLRDDPLVSNSSLFGSIIPLVSPTKATLYRSGRVWMSDPSICRSRLID